MAQQVIYRLIDDTDGGEAEETLRFAFDGTHYEIDLSSKNASAFREAFALYVAAARRVKAGASRPPKGTSTSAVDREHNQAVREWAKGKGLKVSERGRIPVEIMDKYDADQRNASDAATVKRAAKKAATKKPAEFVDAVPAE